MLFLRLSSILLGIIKRIASRAVKLAVKGQLELANLGQPADLVQPAEMAQTAVFSSRLGGLKVVSYQTEQ